MPLQQLLILGIASMAALAVLRVARVNRGLTPLPDGRGRRLFLLGFVILPPIVLGIVTQPAPPANQMWGVGAVPTYVAIVAGIAILMWLASAFIGQVAHGRTSRLLRVALSGHEVDPYEAKVDPPVTATLAEGVATVDRANAAFPRGPGFPSQISRNGFRDDWEELDGATRTLENRIAAEHRQGLSVARAVSETASDARSRLDTLRLLAIDDGQAWAPA